MQEIVQIENNEVMTTSLMVAEKFDKNHKDVLKAIDNLEKAWRNIAPTHAFEDWFKSTTYIHESNGREFRMFNMTKDGFVLLAGGFTDKKFLEFKINYIEQFNLMEEHIRNQQSQSFFITEDAEQQAKRIKLENATANTNSRTMNALYRWYKEAQKQGDMEMQEVMRAQVMDMYPGRKSTTTAIETTTVVPDTSEYYLTATNIANRLGNSVTPEEIGAIANALGLGQHERVQTGSGLAKKFRYNESGFKAIQKYLREN